MGVLVVYESMFGNTRAVAAAVADGLRSRTSVTVVEVGTAAREVPADVELVVVARSSHWRRGASALGDTVEQRLGQPTSKE